MSIFATQWLFMKITNCKINLTEILRKRKIEPVLRNFSAPHTNMKPCFASSSEKQDDEKKEAL